MSRMHEVLRLEDYKLEELLRSTRGQAERGGERDVTWKQLAQYAASHCLNEFYALPIEARTEQSITAIIERRWSNRYYKFHSNEHYLQMKQKVISHLTAYLTGEYRTCEPIVRFEQLSAYVPSIDMELSQIFQLIIEDVSAVNGYTVQKYVIDENEAAVSTFFHMTTVFCAHAFEVLPVTIEVLSLLSGKRFVCYPDELTLLQSLDYMRLAKSLLPLPSVELVN
ncbi:hypothetical protein [Paenibacillus harenae]|uniref:Uncharacterized protein n=1 Tax=Paenibacillus harenae TaxID=306543 RepID=A0ABT9U6H4_PAEHA|nr:hypothetical protein [Paenibacillus harenae]MDQ0114656.1 hypothetical protein [Paenibacillus harenae]